MTDAKTLKLLEAQERQRLLRIERQAKARQEAREVADGLAETVDLAEARGSALEVPQARRGRAEPVRRLTGLEWLERQGKLKGESLALALDYGEAYREATADARLKSCLAEPAGGKPPSPSALLHRARNRMRAAERLHAYRTAIGHQPDLVRACDAICGEEKTPREAARNGQEAAQLTALVIAAVGVMLAATTQRRAA